MKWSKCHVPSTQTGNLPEPRKDVNRQAASPAPFPSYMSSNFLPISYTFLSSYLPCQVGGAHQDLSDQQSFLHCTARRNPVVSLASAGSLAQFLISNPSTITFYYCFASALRFHQSALLILVVKRPGEDTCLIRLFCCTVSLPVEECWERGLACTTWSCALPARGRSDLASPACALSSSQRYANLYATTMRRLSTSTACDYKAVSSMTK